VGGCTDELRAHMDEKKACTDERRARTATEEGRVCLRGGCTRLRAIEHLSSREHKRAPKGINELPRDI
jgi:hypothetical protein